MHISHKTKRRLRFYYEFFTRQGNVPSAAVKRKLLFIHIPKAAGTSVSMSLYGFQVGHRMYKEYFAADRRNLMECVTFAICRNPLDRLYSAFVFLKKGGLTKTDKLIAREIGDIAFEKFVFGPLERYMRQGVIHFLPQYQFVERYGEGPVGVDYILHLENLNEEISFMFKQEHIEPFSLGQENVTEYGADAGKGNLFSEEIRSKVFDVYHKDYWLFNYAP